MDMLLPALLALAMPSSVGDRLLIIRTLNSTDWAQIANDYMAKGEEKACAELIEKSQRKFDPAHPIDPNVRASFVVRLIFQPRAKTPLRPPGLGGLPLPEKSMPLRSWPLYPFFQTRGVLFLMWEGYVLAGLPEPCSSYIAYCKKEGKFRKAPYNVPSAGQTNLALTAFLKSSQWTGIKWSFKSPSYSYNYPPQMIEGYLKQQIRGSGE